MTDDSISDENEMGLYFFQQNSRQPNVQRIVFLSPIMIFINIVTANSGTIQLPQTGHTKCCNSAVVEISCSGNDQRH